MLTVEFQLAPHALAYPVDVRLRRSRDRWVAESVAAGVHRVGLGATPLEALTAALEPLGDPQVTTFLADLGLLRPSVENLSERSVASG